MQRYGKTAGWLGFILLLTKQMIATGRKWAIRIERRYHGSFTVGAIVIVIVLVAAYRIPKVCPDIR